MRYFPFVLALRARSPVCILRSQDTSVGTRPISSAQQPHEACGYRSGCAGLGHLERRLFDSRKILIVRVCEARASNTSYGGVSWDVPSARAETLSPDF